MALGKQVQSDGDIREQKSPGGPSGAIWRKSSWSAYNGNCVEVARLQADLIAVRDTKDVGCGPMLTFGTAAWGSFLNALKNGDLPI